MRQIRKNTVMVLVAFISIFMFQSILPFHVNASEGTEQQTVKVGFFSSEGYHEMDEEGTMSGYGFDFLQMMLRYNDWNYAFIGYDSNWSDMLTMLDNGEIDMVTLADKTPERELKYAYSEKPIGTSSTIMTMNAQNTDIVSGDYDTYDGAVVGLVTGSSHNKDFENYAAEKGFTYSTVYYDDINDLLSDLRTGNQIDIAVTSNMRKEENEIILDEFNSNDYYVIVKKGNEDLLAEINRGISQLDLYSPNWKSELFDKYYTNSESKVTSYTAEENEYLQSLKNEKKTIKAAMNPELKPYSYFVNGKAQGIVPVLFDKVAKQLGISYEILDSSDRWEYKEQLHSGEADIDLTAFLNYSLAQKYNLKETDAYLTTELGMLTRKDSNIGKEDMIVASVKDPTEYIGFNDDLIYQYKTKEYDSIQECIDAVKNGNADATFQYIYLAEQAVLGDETNQLQYTILQNHSFGLCIGVNNEEDHRLLSLLNKGVNCLSTSFTQEVMLEESANVDNTTSLKALAYDHPFLMLAVIIIFFAVLIVICLLLFMYRTQKNRLQASKEMERFISYVCQSYDTVAEINLKTMKMIEYRLVDHKLIEQRTKYQKFDRDYFTDKVPEESLEMIVAAFSDETINRMIDDGGQEQYFECKVKNEEGVFHWYSYLIKSVPRDAKHPGNFVVFKKNIQMNKVEEERQKEILMDALESAKSASEAKGQFLSRMSHEIRTPLNAVIGYMEIAKDSGENPSKMMHCVENSDIAAKHLLSIINDVLDISSIESGRMKIAHEEFDLKKQITSVSTIYYQQASRKGIGFEVNIKDLTHEWVIGDSLRLNQILMNLLSNAMKFTPQDGKVTLEVAQLNEDDKKVYMKFSVADTGIGMSEEYKKRLFQPFEQESASTAKKYGGTGLGLSISYNLIQMMGGSIEVHSKQNEGTRFDVLLYFNQSQENHESKAVHQDYSHVRVLIVDDDEAACEYMKALLKRCKAKCDIVRSGEEAIKQIRRRTGTDYAYNMCIMDWNMPEMDGITTAKKIREEFDVTMPIIIATAYDVTEFEDEAKEAGVDKVIAKPLFQSTIFDLLVSTYGKYEPVETEEKRPENIAGLHILLAEDNPMNQEIAIEILKKAGMYVDAVSDGAAAVEAFKNAKAGTYDAVLMDVQMPVMDGYQATEAIRESEHPEAKSMPIIAMTANAFAEDVNTALARGMNGHIAKPVDYSKLYTTLSKVCGEKEQKRHE